jgi:hypothetical protein
MNVKVGGTYILLPISSLFNDSFSVTQIIASIEWISE